MWYCPAFVSRVAMHWKRASQNIIVFTSSSLDKVWVDGKFWERNSSRHHRNHTVLKPIYISFSVQLSISIWSRTIVLPVIWENRYRPAFCIQFRSVFVFWILPVCVCVCLCKGECEGVCEEWSMKLSWPVICFSVCYMLLRGYFFVVASAVHWYPPFDRSYPLNYRVAVDLSEKKKYLQHVSRYLFPLKCIV